MITSALMITSITDSGLEICQTVELVRLPVPRRMLEGRFQARHSLQPRTARAVSPPKEKLLRQHRFLSSTLMTLALCCLAGSSSAQSPSRYTAGVMLGFGGATGSGPSGSTTGDVYLLADRFDLGYQLFFALETRKDVLFGVRFGQMDVEIANASLLALFGSSVDSELTYLSLSGEYRMSSGTYQSGLFIGLGYYSVDGQSVFGDDTGLGLNLGTTGEFRLNDRWSIMVEFSGHYADIEYAQFFVMGHAGLVVHF